MSILNHFPVGTLTFLVQFVFAPLFEATCICPVVGETQIAGYLWPRAPEFPFFPATRKMEEYLPFVQLLIFRSIETQKLGPHFGIVPEMAIKLF